MTRPIHTRNYGFTLIELLVVVAIIALLISILLPSLGKAREMAKAVACSSNLKTFGTGQHMYANDNDGYFVPLKTATGDSDWGSYDPWYANPAYLRLLGTEKTNWRRDVIPRGLLCPNLPEERIDLWNRDAFSYAVNLHAIPKVPDNGGWSAMHVVHQVSIGQPTGKLQMMDASGWTLGYGQANYTQYWDLTGEAGSIAAVAYRHEEGTNALHIDGHVAPYTKQAFYDIDWNTRVARWYLDR